MKKGIYSKVVEEILSKEDEILKNIGKESISVYLFLKNEYKKGNIKNNNLFQFVFRSYYGLDRAGLGDKLKEVSNQRGQNTIQFSFATKLLHAIDNNSPISDAKILRVFYKRRRTDGSKEEKIKSCLEIYEFLKDTYSCFLQEGQLKKLILKFREKFDVTENKMSDIKVVDFIIWSLGKLSTKKIN